jgi:hypothetical protein
MYNMGPTIDVQLEEAQDKKGSVRSAFATHPRSWEISMIDQLGVLERTGETLFWNDVIVYTGGSFGVGVKVNAVIVYT